MPSAISHGELLGVFVARFGPMGCGFVRGDERKTFICTRGILGRSLFLFLLVGLLDVSPSVSTSAALLRRGCALGLSFGSTHLRRILSTVVGRSKIGVTCDDSRLRGSQIMSISVRASSVLATLHSMLNSNCSFGRVRSCVTVTQGRASRRSSIVGGAIVSSEV